MEGATLARAFNFLLVLTNIINNILFKVRLESIAILNNRCYF